ncbi:DUF971 domain-containing protein [Phototrophicus methaneseepsis]|uniref:DUF971 domain-containing protein n=1 Tax=Phototrophicus methaneseepsis TaxID=2710758 RepID=A0A7S8IE69_9CHLR|nr:DUF971 domain-containing protein [Phototrophicus methaneseepsis]QPC81523.1 DUF971 domain-containing protein [Phototrophicus methaneseepsis]
MDARPTNITLNKAEAYLEITWSDDKVCQYPLSHLREACPCVECRGGHQFMGMEHAPDNLLMLQPARNYNMSELHPIGNYALQPVWDDGHDTGIYTWEYLRHLCP